MWQKRNYKDPRYVLFRRKVRKRDGYKCKWPGCPERRNLHVHHLKVWSKNPLIRFNTLNGITLCKKHHDKIKGKEKIYEGLLRRMLHGI